MNAIFLSEIEKEFVHLIHTCNLFHTIPTNCCCHLLLLFFVDEFPKYAVSYNTYVIPFIENFLLN